MDTTFTIAKLFYNRFGEPYKEYVLYLLPMTEKEAYTMRSKMTNLLDWIVKEIPLTENKDNI